MRAAVVVGVTVILLGLLVSAWFATPCEWDSVAPGSESRYTGCK